MTQIERNYVIQGYRLPRGWDWKKVRTLRAAYRIVDRHMPLACGGGVVAWGVPMKNGKYLSSDLRSPQEALEDEMLTPSCG